MIIYNVTIAVVPELEVEFIQWLKETHLPEVMDTGCFLNCSVYRVMEDPDAKTWNSHAVQYHLENWEAYYHYRDNFASKLRQKTIEKYGDNVMTFRSFLEKVD